MKLVCPAAPHAEQSRPGHCFGDPRRKRAGRPFPGPPPPGIPRRLGGTAPGPRDGIRFASDRFAPMQVVQLLCTTVHHILKRTGRARPTQFNAALEQCRA